MEYNDRTFSEQAREVLARLNMEAQQFNVREARTEHLLLALLTQTGCPACVVLSRSGADGAAVARVVAELSRSEDTLVRKRVVPLSDEAAVAIDCAEEWAAVFGKEEINTEHLLLGMLEDSGGGAGQVLRLLGINGVTVRDELLEMIRSYSE